MTVCHHCGREYAKAGRQGGKQVTPTVSDRRSLNIMSKQSDPLKVTAQELHRFWFTISKVEQWYQIMRECRTWFGRDWRTMSKVRRKLDPQRRFAPRLALTPLPVWFDVPDPRFATWISVKMSIQVASDAKYQAAK